MNIPATWASQVMTQQPSDKMPGFGEVEQFQALFKPEARIQVFSPSSFMGRISPSGKLQHLILFFQSSSLIINTLGQ